MFTGFQVVEILNQSQIDAYVDAIIAVETCKASADSVLEKWLFPVFCHMNHSQKYQLLIDLKRNQSSRLKGDPSCLIFHKKMTSFVLQRCLESTGSAYQMIRDLADYFLQLGEPQLEPLKY